MKKIGFGKKSPDGDDDSNRTGLFGRKKSPRQDENPYARQPAEDAYAKLTPYQQARARASQGGPARPGAAGPPSGPSQNGTYGAAPPPYSGGPQQSSGYPAGPQPTSGYGAGKLGATGGYGTNRYANDGAPPYGGNPAASAPSQPGSYASSRGPGGYGGLGRTESTATDTNRNALFSGAQTREVQRQGAVAEDGPGQSGASSGSYGGYQTQQELTEEEQEKEDVRNMSRQIRDVRQESVRTLDRSLAMADQAIDTGLGTYLNLGVQSERLYNTEKNLDLAANQSKIASEKASELKTLNRSMFAIHVSNPFTAGRRAEERDQLVLDRHRAEREQREATRRDAYQATQRMETSFRDLGRPQGLLGASSNAADRSKHIFVDDEDDPELAAQDERDEKAIDSKMTELSRKVGQLNTIGRRMGDEVDQQIGHIDRIAAKSDAVDDSVRMNREKLNRIR